MPGALTKVVETMKKSTNWKMMSMSGVTSTRTSSRRWLEREKFTGALQGAGRGEASRRTAPTRLQDLQERERPLFQISGHKVKTQGITPNLVIDVSITHDRIGSSTAHPQSNGTLSHPNTPDAPLNEAANGKFHKF